MPVNDKLKRLGVGRTTKKFVGQSPVERVVTETIEKTPVKRLSEVEQFKKELDNISKRAQLIKATEDELERMEEEREHKKKVDFVNKTLATPFSQGKEVDFEPVKQKTVEEYLPKAQIPEQIEYPEPFQEEPALNRELAEFKKKINQHLHQVGFMGSGGGGIGDIKDAGDVDAGTALVDGKFLKFDSSTQKFVGADASSSGATAADDISAGDAAINITTTSGNITIDAAANNSDIIFKGTDGGSDTTFLTIDGSAAGAATFNDKIVATELDISGDVDVDGTLEADAITVNGTTLTETVQDIVGAMVSSNTESGITVAYQDADGTLDFTVGTLNQDTTGSAATLTTARTIGGVSFDGSANINLPGVNTSGNQDTTGNAATATALETARNIGGVSFDGTGNINLPGVNTSGSQDTSGNAATATALATARNIAGVSFDGTANISLVLTNLGISDGNDGQFLKTDGSGTFSFADVSISSFAADNLSAGDAAINLTTSSGNITIDAAANNSDIIFKGTDGGSDITMLTLDGSDAGKAIFNGAISATTITLSADGGVIVPDDGNIGSASSTAAMQISSGGIVTFVDDIKIKDDGTIGTATTAGAIAIAADGTVNLATAGATVNSAVIQIAGTETIFVPASSMRPSSANGCAAITDVATAGGRPDLQVLDFDASADEHAQFQLALPKRWNESTIKFRVYWTSAASDTDGVTWGLQGVSCSDDDTISVSFGTAVVIDDAILGAASDMCVSAVSGDLTIAGSPAAGDMTFFRIFRDVSDSNDNASEDARLIGVELIITTDAGNDA